MNLRSTKIICTLGPASHTREQISHLAKAGMNIARINLSHGTQDQHRETIKILQELNGSGNLEKLNPAVSGIAIMLDTKGAEIRTGDVTSPLHVREGEEIIFAMEKNPDESRQTIIIDYRNFAKDVQRAERILLDNGELAFDLVSIEKDGTVIARAREEGTIGSRRHVNLPGANVDLPSITEKDWSDIAFAAEEKVDFIALSFVQYGRNVQEVREFLTARGSGIQLISKIESQRAVQNISEILHMSDGIMVARGDLGAEVPFETLPVIQDDIVNLCKEAGKPVIVATHMLESMITRPMPTRAEVTDIAHAAHTRADATMLSGETAAGKYPLAALVAMDKVLRATEKHAARFSISEEARIHNDREARAEAAVTLAASTNVDALFVITRTGQTAMDVSKFRPHVPIIACTDDPKVQRHLQLRYGVIPLLCILSDDPEETIVAAMKLVTRLELLPSGARVVLVSDTQAHDITVNSIQIRSIL